MAAWPVPEALQAASDAAEAFARRCARAAGEPGALGRIAGGGSPCHEAPPSGPALGPEARAAVLRALLWDAVEAGRPGAVRALLGAGAALWEGGALVRDARIFCESGGPSRREGIWHHRTETLPKFFYNLPFRRDIGHWQGAAGENSGALPADRPAALREICAELLGAGAPFPPVLCALRRDCETAAAFPSDAPWSAQLLERALWWAELLHPHAPGEVLELLRRVSAGLALVAPLDLLARAASLRRGLAEWRPARRAWIGAVVRACPARRPGARAGAKTEGALSV